MSHTTIVTREGDWYFIQCTECPYEAEYKDKYKVIIEGDPVVHSGTFIPPGLDFETEIAN